MVFKNEVRFYCKIDLKHTVCSVWEHEEKAMVKCQECPEPEVGILDAARIKVIQDTPSYIGGGELPLEYHLRKVDSSFPFRFSVFPRANNPSRC